MKRSIVATAGLLVSSGLLADNLHGVDRFLCATVQIVVCVEEGDCYDVLASEADVPEFVVVDVKNKMLSTTKASQANRVTKIGTMSRTDGHIYLQGVELGRAFSFVIDEESGHATVAVSRDGLTVTVFGSCTSAEI